MDIKITRSAETVNTVINGFLERNGILDENPSWQIRQSSLGGLGIFAKRNILPGDVIFLDYPVIIGPRCMSGAQRICVVCYSRGNLERCPKNCGLLLCSTCKLTTSHNDECDLIRRYTNANISNNEMMDHLSRCLTPLRSLLLSSADKEVVLHLKSHKGNRHGFEVDVLTKIVNCKIDAEITSYLKFVCSVMDANAFEVVIGNEETQSTVRGLYPLGSLANHRCFPNTFHVFDSKQRMVTRASIMIKKDEEIFHSYTRLIWGTPSRIFHLQNTKHFICKCNRCLDPTEFGTYMNSILCGRCKGNVIPVNPVKKYDWKCETCGSVVPMKEVGSIFKLIGSVLKGFGNEDFSFMYRFLTQKLCQLVPEYNEAVVELKYKMVWMLGYAPGFLWEELSMETIEIKKKFCEDILTLLEKLQVGLCKIRGLLLYEVYLCLEEMNKREKKIDRCGGKYLKEAADILKYDVSAPTTIKQLFT